MKILILTAATGGGHLRASSALKSYILETQEDCEVENCGHLEIYQSSAG